MENSDNSLLQPVDHNILEAQQSLMMPDEAGILRRKGGGFNTPSIFAVNHLFYPIWGDEYTCRYPYRVSRNSINLYSLFRITNGFLYFIYEGHEFSAAPGDVVLIDGRKEHVYYAKEPVTFLHFSFRGNESDAYYQLLTQNSVLFRDKSEVLYLFRNIIEELEEPEPDDHLLSSQIHMILSSLAKQKAKKVSPAVQKAQNYIMENFQRNILVEDIAADVSLSKYHFSRIFKAETGFTPHDYLFKIRIRNSQKLLVETTKSVESIALNCGFTNTSSFIRAFKKETMITPAMFRKFFDPSGFR